MDSFGNSNNRNGRPNYLTRFKRLLAMTVCEQGVWVSKLPQQHGINVNMLFKWRRDLHAGRLVELKIPSSKCCRI
jgi:transposase